MKNALVTFIYPGAEKYFNEFLPYVAMARSRELEVIAFNDYCASVPEWAMIVPVYGAIVDNRIFALQWLKLSGYASVIFLDIDDAMDSIRIPTVLDMLGEYRVVCNDVIPFSKTLPEDGSKGIWAERFAELPFAFDSDFLTSFNIIGFGNTGVRIDQLPVEQLKTSELPVMADWFIFKQLLYNAAVSAVFTGECCTWYRQHDNNIAGIKLRSKEYLEYINKIRNMHDRACSDIGIQNHPVNDKYSKKILSPNSYANYFWWEQ